MINSALDLRLQMGINTEEDLKKDNLEIKKQTELMNQTMNDFKDFFKQTQKENYIVKDIVLKSIQLINHIYKSNGININIIKSNDASTEGFSNELIQVIINILNNARDIILEQKVKYTQIDIYLSVDSNYIYISIQDYAGGIPNEVLPKVFDPYFTTKEEDKGTGLGLHMSKMIIEKVNGTLEVQNNEIIKDDKKVIGANFIIKLPKA